MTATPKAFAQTIVTTRNIDGVRYTLWSDNTASVESTGSEGTPSFHTQFSGQLDFLQTISYNNADYTLTKIGSFAFSRNENLTGISIPSTVTSIGGAAFRYCYGVTGTIALPDGLTTIGDEAFIGCGFHWYAGHSEQCDLCRDKCVLLSPMLLGGHWRWLERDTRLRIPRLVTHIQHRTWAQCHFDWQYGVSWL